MKKPFFGNIKLLENNFFFILRKLQKVVKLVISKMGMVLQKLCQERKVVAKVYKSTYT